MEDVLAVKSRTEKAQVYEYLHPLFCVGSIKSYESIFLSWTIQVVQQYIVSSLHCLHPNCGPTMSTFELLGKISIVDLKTRGMCGSPM